MASEARTVFPVCTVEKVFPPDSERAGHPNRSTFYNWYRRYLEDGVEGLGPKKPKAGTFWNKVSEEVKEQVVFEALKQTELSPIELACRITDRRVLHLRIQRLSDS
jgi:hypothetical protein